MPRVSRRDLLFASIEASIALVLTLALGVFATEHSLVNNLTEHGGLTSVFVNLGEGRLFTAYFLTAIPAAILLARAAARVRPAFGEGAILSRIRAPLAAALLAVLAALLSETIATIIEHTPLTDDEWVYLFEARCLTTGHLSAAIPHPQELFRYRFTVFTPDGRLAGVYPLGQPILLAIGMLVAHPHLSQLVCMAGIVYVASRLADDVAGPEAAVLTALLVATSPALLCAAATYHNDVPTTLFALVAIRAVLAFASSGRMRDAVLVGLGIGAVFLCRPFDGTLFGVACAVVIASRLRVATTRKRIVAGAGVALVCAAPFMVAYLLTNRALTGDASLPAYVVFSKEHFGDVKVVGFGPGVFGIVHTPEVAVSKLIVVVARISHWLFGWPLSLAPLLLLLFGVPLEKRATAILGFVGVLFAGYFFYVWNSVHDIGSLYHLPAMPLLAIVSAVILLRAREQLPESARAWPLRLVWASMILTVITFWPLELMQLRTTSLVAGRVSRAGRELAARGPALIFYNGKRQPPFESWVYYPPLPDPKLEDPMLFVFDRGNRTEAAARFPGRTPYRMQIGRDGVVEVGPAIVSSSSAPRPK